MKLNNLLGKKRIVSSSRDVLAGLVVAFAMIPEAIAFSGIAGVDPRVGLFGAFLLSVTLAIFGGRMAMITSVTGSTALLMTGIVQQGENISPGLGLQYLLAAGLLTGVLQIAWGYKTCTSDEICTSTCYGWLCEWFGYFDLPCTIASFGD